jgi:hypothetical protein
MFALSKAAGLNRLVQGGQLYSAFPAAGVSWLAYHIIKDLLAWH